MCTLADRQPGKDAKGAIMAGSDISTNGTDTGADALRNADGQSPARQFVAVNAQLASEEGALQIGRAHV